MGMMNKRLTKGTVYVVQYGENVWHYRTQKAAWDRLVSLRKEHDGFGIVHYALFVDEQKQAHMAYRLTDHKVRDYVKSPA